MTQLFKDKLLTLLALPCCAMLPLLDSPIVAIGGAVFGPLRERFLVPSAFVVLGGGKVPTTGSFTSAR